MIPGTTINSRPDGYKDFVAILLLHRIYPAQDILRVIEDIGVDVVTAEQIQARLSPTKTSMDTLVPDELQQIRLMTQNPARYDALTKGVVH